MPLNVQGVSCVCGVRAGCVKLKTCVVALFFEADG